METIFGHSWASLKLKHVQAFLADAEGEPLLWEAKGIKVSGGTVRKQVCGFANTHDGGYLIIGATWCEGSWTFDGVSFPGSDPPTWVSSVVGNGVTPYPEGLDTKPFKTDAGYVAVVWIPPVATPPCNTKGTVYERVSGQTLSVREPVRLAELFARGDSARQAGAKRAEHAALEAILHGRDHPAHQANRIQFGLGFAAAGYRRDVSRVPFTRSFEQAASSSIKATLSHGALLLRSEPAIATGVTQDARSFLTKSTDMVLGSSWSIRATWHGAISVYWVQGVEKARVSTVVPPIKEAWL